jgi:hypothetical protein
LSASALKRDVGHDQVTGTEGQKHDLEQETILPTTQLGKFNRFAATEAPKQKVQRASLKEADEVCQTNRKKSRQDHTTFQWIYKCSEGLEGLHCQTND